MYLYIDADGNPTYTELPPYANDFDLMEKGQLRVFEFSDAVVGIELTIGLDGHRGTKAVEPAIRAVDPDGKTYTVGAWEVEKWPQSYTALKIQDPNNEAPATT